MQTPSLLAEQQAALDRGMDWLLAAVDSDRFTECSPIGFYFAKLWYYEALYPIIFTASALSSGLKQMPQSAQPPTTTPLEC